MLSRVIRETPREHSMVSHHAPSHAHTDKTIRKSYISHQTTFVYQRKLVRTFIWELCAKREVLTAKRLKGAEIMPWESERESRARYCQSASKSRNEKWQLGVKYNWHWFDAKTFFREGLFGLKGNIYGKWARRWHIVAFKYLCVYHLFSNIHTTL